MANPNIVNVSTITGNTTYVALSSTSATTLLSNAASSGDLTVWFYDVTNGQLIQGAPSSIQNSQLIERFQSEVQIPINCAEMRVIIHVSTATSAVGYTIRFDNFSFGSSEKLYGSQTSDWIDYTPTFNSGLLS